LTSLLACLLPISAISQTAEGNVPIAFYGKVVDQNALPIAGATVKLKVITSHFATATTEEKEYPLETDANGAFTLTSAFGVSLFITSIQKPGYELSKKADLGYVYALTGSFHPDPASPVVIRMWKIAGKEPLVGSAWHGRVACDGTANRFDLYTGKPSADGTLEITCTRTPLNFEITSRQPFDYKCEVVIIGGGIQPTADEFTYRTPESGYSPNVTIDRKPGDPKWGGGLRQEFYIKTAKGEYGRLAVDWDAGHRPAPTHFEWNCSINPSGTRNLER
jgi:hypothetical protein